MELSELEVWLVRLAVGFFLVAVMTVVTYFVYSRRRATSALASDDVKLRYFVQRQVDAQGQLSGYECLLRQRTEDGSWVLPAQLESLPLRRAIELLDDTFAALPSEATRLSINLSYEQIMSSEFLYFVRWAVSKIRPMQLEIEMNVHTRQLSRRRWRFRRHIRRGKAYGMQFALDNIGSDNNDLDRIQWMLPLIDTLKCSMKSFRKKDPSVWLDVNLQFWNVFAREHSIRLVLIGVEDAQDLALAEQLGISLRQGFLFDRPSDPVAARAAQTVSPQPSAPGAESASPSARRQIYTDLYFEPGHWWRKIWQTVVALVGWCAVIVPVIVTVQSYTAARTGFGTPFWTYSEGLFEIEFIGMILAFCAVIILTYTLSMTIIQVRKRARLVDQWPTFDPIERDQRRDAVAAFMDQRFGDADFRHTVRTYWVEPEQNLETNALQRLFTRRHAAQRRGLGKSR